jgi:UDP-N-acetylmuramoylalanine--D-glutamate ligase
MLDVNGKRAAVVGLGASGIAACTLLAARGARVIGTDRKPREQASPEALALEAAGVSLALGGHAEARLSEADLVVVSPGVPSFEELEAAAVAKVPIWGEVELAYQAVRAAEHARLAGVAGVAGVVGAAPARAGARFVAIGGTNGKSTVTSLTGALLEAHGLATFTGGNLGEPLAAHAGEAFDAIVLEVSSFQMERVEAFHPEVSVLLNVTPDHLDRYDDLAAYARAKGNAFTNQEPGDLAIVPAGDPVCLVQAKRGRGRVVRFGADADADVCVQNARIFDRATGEAYDRAKIRLKGGHNALNVAAALAAVRPFGIPSATIREVLASFEGLPHRMALVGEARGIRWYDDSKGTNVGAAVTAILGVAEPRVVLIAGGRDKGGSYAPLASALAEKGRAAVVIGEAADAIAGAIGGVVPVKRAASMDEAVALAGAAAEAGDAVLLSPACSSFDMFKDYKERGDVFARAVKGVLGGTGR